jgi:hypothetical protein
VRGQHRRSLYRAIANEAYIYSFPLVNSTASNIHISLTEAHPSGTLGSKNVPIRRTASDSIGKLAA